MSEPMVIAEALEAMTDQLRGELMDEINALAARLATLEMDEQGRGADPYKTYDFGRFSVAREIVGRLRNGWPLSPVVENIALFIEEEYLSNE